MSRLLGSIARTVCQGSPTRHITSLPTRSITRCSSHPAGCAVTLSPCRTVTTAALSSASSCQGGTPDAFSLVESSMGTIMEEIHTRLDSELVLNTEIGDLAR